MNGKERAFSSTLFAVSGVMSVSGELSVAMLNPKDHLSGLPDYRAGRSSAAVKAERSLDEVVALASNESSAGPLPSVVQVIADAMSTPHRYPETRSQSLGAAIAAFHDVDESRIAVGPGSAALLWQLGQAFLDQSSTVVAPEPSFEGYPLIAATANATYVPVPLVDQTIDVDAVIAATTAEADVVLIAEPNNPTGTAIGGAGLKRLIEHTRSRCALVIDEAYIEFNDHPEVVDAVELARDEPHVIVMRTFSKAYGLAGLRVGYAIGEPRTCTYLNRVAPPFTVTTLAQEAAAASLLAVDELRTRIESVISERTRLGDALRQAGHTVGVSRANFVFLELAEPEPLAEQLEARGVITRPIAGEGLRVTVGSPAENDKFLAALADASTT